MQYHRMDEEVSLSIFHGIYGQNLQSSLNIGSCRYYISLYEDNIHICNFKKVKGDFHTTHSCSLLFINLAFSLCTHLLVPIIHIKTTSYICRFLVSHPECLLIIFFKIHSENQPTKYL